MNEDILERVAIIAELTDSEPEDWEPSKGPDSGLGEDYYYIHSTDGREVWVNIDQDYVTIVCDGQTLHEGEIEE